MQDELVMEAGTPANRGRRAQLAARANLLLAQIVAVPAAIIIVIEVVLLAVNVVARYFVNSPITWADEAATALLIWLVMLGAVIAAQRGQHMRVTTFTQRLSKEWRSRAEALSYVASAALLVAVFIPAVHHVESQMVLVMQMTGLNDSFRVLALPVGIGLMWLSIVLTMIERTALRECFLALAAIVVLSLIISLVAPPLQSVAHLDLLLFFVVALFGCIMAGIPIAFCFGIATITYIAIMTDVPTVVMVGRMDEGVSHYILLSVPLFILLGFLIEVTGLAGALVRCMMAMFGHIRGSLGYVLIGCMYLVSGISGSKIADMAAVAPGLLPEMRRRGERQEELAALLASTGAQTETIPPSLVLILIGAVGGVSIISLFENGLLPAAACGLALCIVVYFKSRRSKTAPGERLSGRARLAAVWFAMPALILPVIIRLAVGEGIATATEVATVGVIYTLIVGPIVYRQMDWRRLYPLLVNTAAICGTIMIVFGFASGMAWALTQSGFSSLLIETMTSIPGGTASFMIVSIVVFVVLGSLLEGLPCILVFAPLLLPAARLMGIDDVHYSMVIIISMGIGLFAPPFGIGYYAACSIAGVDPARVMPYVWPYLAAVGTALIIIAAVPQLSTAFS